jgi:hypothetical protein
LRDRVKKVAEVGQRITDVLVHYPSDHDQEYPPHHHVTVM